MQSRLKRIVSGAAACAVAAGTFTMLSTSVASATHLTGGTNEVINPATGALLTTGNSNTPFRFRLPPGPAASCTGDSTNSGYRVNSYIVPASVDLDTLKFSAAGPVAVAGQFRKPMFEDISGTEFAEVQTANQLEANGPGQINQPLPNFSFFALEQFFPGMTPGQPPNDFALPPGVYNLGIACTLGAPSSPTQLDKYFNTVMTIVADSTDPGTAKIRWTVGAPATAPAAPVLTSVTSGDTTLTATYSASASTPPTTNFTVTATPPSGPAIVVNSPSGSPTTIPGLTNGIAYSVTVTATNSAGTSPASNAISGTPAQPASPGVTSLTATPITGGVNLSWNAPADAATRPPTGYTVTNTPGGGTTSISGTTASVTGLTPGTLYSFTVTPTYASGPAGTPASVNNIAPLAAQVLTQTITVTRPVGALVFTQICGKNGTIPADTLGSPGFPNGSIPTVTATGAGVGTAPDFADGTDPKFSEYPYPTNPDGTPAPNYPTNCGVALGNAKFVATGSGAGKFFAASGVLSQVTVVDTRDTDIGWTANGTMGRFNSGPRSFSGSQLGWSPVATSNTEAFTDSDGNVYDQVTSPGAVVAPNTPNATGMSSGVALGTAAALAGPADNATGGLGIAEFDARLKLLIPVTAKSGDYVGTLTISAI